MGANKSALFIGRGETLASACDDLQEQLQKHYCKEARVNFVPNSIVKISPRCVAYDGTACTKKGGKIHTVELSADGKCWYVATVRIK